MGLFSSLFGSSKKTAQGPTLDKAALMRITTGAPSSDDDASAILDLTGREKNFKNRVEAFNILIDEGRKEWAEAYARLVAQLPDTPPFILKALASQHFLQEGKIGEFLEPARVALHEYPSETDLALAVGKIQLKNGNYEEGLSDLQAPLESAPESRHLFALIGELYRGAEKHEEAMIHLRTSLELYSEAFKLQTIVTNDLQSEEFEFTRLYGLLEEEARHHVGADGLKEVFENISYTPDDIGVRREGDRMASMRVEYKPARLEISSLSEMETHAEEFSADSPGRHFLLGSAALRKGEYDEAIKQFSRALELDLENHGAYYGWAAAGDLQRNAELSSDAHSDLSSEEKQSIASLFPGWESFTESEQEKAYACAFPVRDKIQGLVESEARVLVQPLDVRLKDVYPEPKQLEFDHSQKNPQFSDSFTGEGKSNLRLDAFLTNTPTRLPLAWHLGMLVYHAEEKSGSDIVKKTEAAFRSHKEASKIAKNPAAFFATAVEIAALQNSFGGTVIEPVLDLKSIL